MPHAHSPSTIHCASLNLWTAHGVCLLLLRAYLAMKIFMHTPQLTNGFSGSQNECKEQSENKTLKGGETYLVVLEGMDRSEILSYLNED